MTFDASGVLCNSCSFVEERFEVNTGETAPMAKERKAELAKKAQEATESVLEGEVTVQPAADAGGGGEEKADEDNAQKSKSSDDDFDF